MTLRKLGWIVGGFGFFCLATVILLFYLSFFTDVFATTFEQVMYDCTACLKQDPTRCKTIEQDWSMHGVKTEDDAREYVAFRLCREVVPRREDAVKHTCGTWVLEQREEVFDIRCTSRLAQLKQRPFGMRVH